MMTVNGVMFNELTNERLVSLMESTGSACIRVMEMPESVRKAQNQKGTTKEQAGVVSAFIFAAAAKELESRGVLPAGWLEEEC